MKTRQKCIIPPKFIWENIRSYWVDQGIDSEQRKTINRLEALDLPLEDQVRCLIYFRENMIYDRVLRWKFNSCLFTKKLR